MMAEKVRASHLLIKHQGSRRPASWKDPDGRRIKSTTKEQAIAQLKTMREEILSGREQFEDLASRDSDCSSAKRSGDLVICKDSAYLRVQNIFRAFNISSPVMKDMKEFEWLSSWLLSTVFYHQ